MTGALPARAVLALAAIAVPAAIVAALGFVSLRQWEASAEFLFREQARDIATMAAEKVEMLLQRAEDDLLAALGRALADGGGPALDEFVRGTPLVGHLELFDRRGQRLYASARGPEDAGLGALVAEISDGFWERGERRHLVVGDTPVLVAVLRARDGSPVLAAVTRSLDGLTRGIFEATLGALEAPTNLAIVDHRGASLWSREPLERESPLLSVPFREGLPSWRVALYAPRGRSPGDTVRRQVMVFMAAFGVLVVLIAAGTVATYRLVRRETEMARLKADFVANVSHDLKTPLSVIRMFGETLELGRVRDEVARQEYYRVITREAERLSRLIDNVLDFSRIEGGRRRYVRVPTAVEPLVRETLEAFGYPLAQRGFTVEVDIPPDLPKVPLDAEAIGQALANLIDNAIKYSGERRWLRVEARIADAVLHVSIADAGIGIPREEHARIFEKFYRVGRSETQGRRGSGVGLAVVRHIVEAHGGRVSVTSRSGEGSRFTLSLPVIEAVADGGGTTAC